MKFKRVWIVLAVILLFTPQIVGASIVFETTGWIMGDDGLVFEFEADTAPYTYRTTLSDLSEAPLFGFDFLYLSITTSTDTVKSIIGPGEFNFAATPGETYFANVFGTGGGELEAGLFGLEIRAVPIPSALMLLGSGILGLFVLKRKTSK